MLNRKNKDGLYDSNNEDDRNLVNLDTFPLLDEDGQEVRVFNAHGKRVLRRRAEIDHNPCGVLMDLEDVHALFKPDRQYPLDVDIYSEDPLVQDLVKVVAYPLGFLRTAGNVQATGIPACFYEALRDINQSIHNNPHRSTDSDNDSASDAPPLPRTNVVRGVSSQFYNHITHRVATRAGRHDTQQGTVTSALAGAFAKTRKDVATATKKQDYCDLGLPSDRFRKRIELEDCPRSCRAEIVYSVDVGSMGDRSGRYVVTSNSLYLSFYLMRSVAPYSQRSFSLLPGHGKGRMYEKASNTI